MCLVCSTYAACVQHTSNISVRASSSDFGLLNIMESFYQVRMQVIGSSCNSLQSESSHVNFLIWPFFADLRSGFIAMCCGD